MGPLRTLNMLKYINLIFFLLIIGILSSCIGQQNSIAHSSLEHSNRIKQLKVDVLFNNEEIVLGDTLVLGNDYVVIEKLKFYISNIEINGKKWKWEQNDSYHL